LSLERFGEFLVRITNGKVTSNDVMEALMKQKRFSDGYMKLGEILVEDKILIKEEMEDYLAKFEEEKLQNKLNKFPVIIK